MNMLSMKIIFPIVLINIIFVRGTISACNSKSASIMYTYKLKTLDGKTSVEMDIYQNKVLLIFICKEGLREDLYYTELLKYADEVQNQDNINIIALKTYSNLGVIKPINKNFINFDVMKQKGIDVYFVRNVNGAAADMLVNFLKTKTNSDDIKWFYTKFVVNKFGSTVLRYEAKTKMEEIKESIKIFIDEPTPENDQELEKDKHEDIREDIPDLNIPLTSEEPEDNQVPRKKKNKNVLNSSNISWGESSSHVG